MIETLKNKWTEFWQVIPAEFNQLVPGFVAEEEERIRTSVRVIGLCGLILVGSLAITNWLFYRQDILVLGSINLIILLMNGLYVINRRPEMRRISIELLFYTGFFIFVGGATIASLILREITSLVLASTVFVVILVIVSSFNYWLASTLFVLVGYLVFINVVGIAPERGAANSYIAVFTVISPFFVWFVNRTAFRQRWQAFLDRHRLEEANEKLQEQTAVLAQTNTLLETRNEELDAFAHTVAHDLKNPFAIVIGYAEILQDEITAAEHPHWHEYLTQVSKAGRKGDSIIRELLLLAAVRREDVELAPLEMGGIVAQALERLSHHVAEQNVELRQPVDWPVVMGYAGWVEEVWVNYISNAIKYGGRPCRLELITQMMPDGWVRFGVHDNGKGLTEEEQSRLFTEFTRLDTQWAEGHGLGLSVVRRIVEKLNGRVGIISGVGQGSTFYFELRQNSQQ
jgi:signal transduction histidine kinase